MRICTAAKVAAFAAISALVVACAATPPTRSVPQPPLTEAQKEQMEVDAIYRDIGSGDLASAVSRLEALSYSKPDNRSYPVLKASVLLSMNKLDDARAALKAEIAAYPDNIDALYALAEVERFAGDAKAHRAAIESLLAKDPKNADAQTAMGDIFYDGKNYSKAEESYRAALASAPGNVDSLLGMARVQYRRDDMPGALENLDKAIAVAPESALAYLDRSRVLYQMGKYEACEADMDMAVKLAPNSSWNYVERGRLYLDTGRKELALADFTKSIGLYPGYFLPYVYRASIYEDSGDDRAAIADYRMVSSLNPDYWYALESIGVLCYRQGLWRDAFYAFDKAASYTKAHSEYYIAAALSLMRAGDPKAAKEYAGKKLAQIDREKFAAQWLALRLIYDQGEMSAELEIKIGVEKNLDAKAGMLFYLGAYWVAKGRPELGSKYIQLSMEAQRIGTIERRMAEADLARLQAPK